MHILDIDKKTSAKLKKKHRLKLKEELHSQDAQHWEDLQLSEVKPKND